jgi:hypothetical protein
LPGEITEAIVAKKRVTKPSAGAAGTVSLEVFNAKFGDALLLHFDTPKGKGLVVIDGGPDGIYTKVIRGRLDELRPAAGGATRDPLGIRLLMVTHIDKDHITGVVDLARDLDKQVGGNIDVPYRVESFWHNSFEDLVGKDTPIAPKPGKAQAASLAASLADLDAFLGHDASAEASVAQGVELRDLAQKHHWRNKEFPGLIVRPATGVSTCDLGGLKFTILGPDQQRIDKLQKEWAKALAKKDRAEAAAIISDVKLDTSVTNLSSIIVLAECAGQRLLLTGDGLGPHVIDGLKQAKLLEADGRFHVDILKLPHHGSIRNTNLAFFQTVIARAYVISANGRDDNPDLACVEALLKARDDDGFIVYLTNEHDDKGKPLPAVEFLKETQKAGRRFKFEVLPKGQPSFLVNLAAAPESAAKPKAAKKTNAKSLKPAKPPKSRKKR